MNAPVFSQDLATGRLAPTGGGAMAWRVVYADTDAMGVVYHARYLDIAERSRTAYMAQAGIYLGEIEREHGILMLVNRVRADYRTPVRLHQDIEVTSAVLKGGITQVWWRSQVFVGDRLAANIDVATACFHRPSGETVAMPPDLAAAVTSLARVEE